LQKCVAGIEPGQRRHVDPAVRVGERVDLLGALEEIGGGQNAPTAIQSQDLSGHRNEGKQVNKAHRSQEKPAHQTVGFRARLDAPE
jgi:hypothetical protein